MFTVPGLGVGGVGGNLGTVWAEMGVDVSRMRSGFQEARREISTMDGEIQNAMNRFGGNLTQIGSMMTLGLTAPLAGFSLISINAAAQFEQAMARVQAVSGATGDQFQQLQEIARELGRETMFTATQAAEGLQYLAMAGWEVEDMVHGIEPVLRMAEAAQIGLGRAADITSDIMTAFRIEAVEAGKVADILAEAAMNANTNIEMLGDTMAYAAPTANALGFDLEEVVAAAGRLADAGIKGSRAGTALDAVFRDLSTVSEDAQRRLREYGIEIYDSEESMRSLVEIIEDYEEATRGVTDAQRAQIMDIGFTSRALRGMNALIGTGAAELASFTGQLRDSDGAVNEMGEAIRDTLRYELTRLRSIMESVLLDIGTILLPMLRENIIPTVLRFAEGVSGLTQAISNWDSSTHTLIVTLGLFVAAAGPAFVLLGKWHAANIALTASIAKVVAALKVKIASIKVAMAALGPMGLAYAGLATALGVWSVASIRAASDTEDLEQQMESFISRSERIDQLIGRYQDLAQQTSLTTVEQRELNTVAQELATLVPEAAAGWDEYNRTLEVNIERARQASEENRRLAASIMETRIREQEEVVDELQRSYEGVRGILVQFDEIHRSIRAAMEDQRDEVVRYNDLEEIRAGTVADIVKMIWEVSESTWEATRRAAQFTNQLWHGELTLADIDSLLLTIGSSWEGIRDRTSEEEERLGRMRDVLDQIRFGVDLQNKSYQELIDLKEHTIKQDAKLIEHLRVIASITQGVRGITSDLTEDSVTVNELVEELVSLSQAGLTHLSNYPAEYSKMLDLVKEITGLTEFQRVTEQDIRDLLADKEAEASKNFELYNMIVEILKDWKREETGITTEKETQKDIMGAIADIYATLAEDLEKLRIRAVGYGQDLDKPVEKMQLLADALADMVDEGIGRGTREFDQITEKAMNLAAEMDHTQDALNAVYELFDALVESGAELSDPVLSSLIEKLGEFRRALRTTAVDEDADLVEPVKDGLEGMVDDAEALQQLTEVEAKTLRDEIEETFEDLPYVQARIQDAQTAEVERGTEERLRIVEEGLEQEGELQEVALEEFGNAWDQFRNGVLQGQRKFAENLENYWRDFGEGLYQAFAADLQQGIRGVLDALLDDNKSVTEALEGMWSRTIDHILDMIAELAAQWLMQDFIGASGFTEGVAGMLGFDRGGQVPGPKGSRHLAIVEGKEWYMPDELMSMVRRAAATPDVVQVGDTGSLDYAKLAQQIGDQVASKVGKLPFTMNVNAVDAASFMDLTRRNPDAIIQTVIENLAYDGALRDRMGRA